MSQDLVKIASVSFDHIVVSAEDVTEDQFVSWLARNNVDREMEKIYRGHPKIFAEIKAGIAQGYQDQLRAQAAFRHLHEHGCLVKIRCFGCGTNYQGWERKPPICPSCGTNNLEVD